MGISNHIPFSSPFIIGREIDYIKLAIQNQHLSGNGNFTNKCHDFFSNKYGFKSCLLTSSCTDALEMTALLSKIGPETEVIIPSFTFVSTANAFMLRGARIKFVDSCTNSPNIDLDLVEDVITESTKVLVLVHYAGIACDMSKVEALKRKHNLLVIEDAAHAIDSYYNSQPLGSFGDLATFSFHETKNVICGEGGLLVINNPQLSDRAEILWEKGTNRAAFARNEVNKYSWIDLGSSFLPSELSAAFLFAQLENINLIQSRRIEIWRKYFDRLSPLAQSGYFKIPFLPRYSTVNGHIFYIVCNGEAEREQLRNYLQSHGICAVFHYIPLHSSPFFCSKHDGRELPNSDRFSRCLLRLPLFYEMHNNQIDKVCDRIYQFFH